MLSTGFALVVGMITHSGDKYIIEGMNETSVIGRRQYLLADNSDLTSVEVPKTV